MRITFMPLCFPLFTATAFAQTISFLPANEVFAASAAAVTPCNGCVAVADFNGDGKPDIAYNIQALTPFQGVLLGNGDGSFRTVGMPGPDLVANASGPVLVGDFNGDGKPDLTLRNAIYLGNGDGTFAAPVRLTNCGAGSIQVADFNRDGRTDILCGTAVLLSNGDGTFRAAGAVGTVAMESSVLVADFNHDGIPDVLLSEVSGLQLAVALGHGDGTFGNSMVFPSPVAANSVLAGDFNGDGFIDLVGYSQKGSFLDVLPGKGDGTFGSAIQTASTSASNPALSVVADFNKDGKLDLVAGDGIYAGNGDGTFRFPVFFGATAYVCGTARSPIAPFPCSHYQHNTTAVGDFNGDGLPDLVAGVYMQGGTSFDFHDVGEVDVLLNDSPGNGFTATGISSATDTWPVGAGSIVSAFGVNLAPTTAAATVNPAPTTLGGIRFHVRDRSHTGDMLAPLLYVSPTQINYVLNSSDPYAWVDIERVGFPYVPQGMTVPIAAVAPGFYSLGGGVAAASAVTVTPYAATPVSVTPIDLSGGPVYLSIYGTGFAQASASASSCTVGGVNVPISYAGPELAIAGLDQVNLMLPKSLAGSGVVPVACTLQTAGGVSGAANTVTVTIR